jgi:hypothetical protein
MPDPGVKVESLPVRRRGCEDDAGAVNGVLAALVFARVGDALEGELAAGAAGDGRAAERAVAWSAT